MTLLKILFMQTIVFMLMQCHQLYGQTLFRKTILITAPEGYSQRFVSAFTDKRFNIIAVPCIKTFIPDNMPDVDRFFKNISCYHYVVFSSRKAVDGFAQGLQKAGIKHKCLDNIKFCAIGKDAEYVFEKLHVEVSVIPDEPSPMGIADKLIEQGEVKDKNIAVFVPEVLGIKEPNIVPDFIAKLKSMGLHVARINAYQTAPENVAQAVTLIKSQKVDCIAFTSSAEIEVLLAQLGDRSFLKNTDIACFGIYTAAFARKKGLHVKVVAKDFSSFQGFVEAISTFYDTL